MYSPNLFPNELYKLWTHDQGSDSVTAFEEFRNKTSGPTNTQTSNSTTRSNEQAEEQRKHLRSLFAPPLSAYSANYAGANLSQLEYTIQKTTSLPGNQPTGASSMLYSSITPLTQLKIDQLEDIRNTGYSTIRPIGINRTMEEIDFENARRFRASESKYDDQSYIHTAENTNTEGQGAGVNGSNVSMRDAATESDIDLDAQIINMDVPEEGDEFENNEFNDQNSQFTDDSDAEADTRIRGHLGFLHSDYHESDIQEQTPAPTRDNLIAEGFMADEVEYQDDHSVIAGNNSHMLINSGTTGSTVVSNINSGNSLGTNFTSIPGSAEREDYGNTSRECNDILENDQSDLDMVIED